MRTPTYNFQSDTWEYETKIVITDNKGDTWEYETKIVITDNKKIEVYRDKDVLTLTKQDDGKVDFEFYDNCEDEWDSGVCHNTFEDIKDTIVKYPFDFQVYSL